MAQEHSTDTQRLAVGLNGWQTADWTDAYYPPDLPEDWRPAYYANEFNCVHLAEAEWVSVDAAQWQEWLDSVAQGFRFYLQASPAVPLERMEQVAEQLSSHLGGFLLQAGDERAPAMAMRPVQGPPGVVAAWQGDMGALVLQLDLAGLDLRAQRAILEALAPSLVPEAPHALLLTGEGVGPEQAAQLRMLAEMMGIA